MTASIGNLLRFDEGLDEAAAGLLAGVDEAGRGCWAGPVVAAAVVLPPGWAPDGLDDSKKLSPRQRTAVFDEIRGRALGWRACAVSAAQIDSLNILQATLLAMTRAIERLHPAPNLVLVDGAQLPVVSCRARSIVGGDGKSAAVAAASVMAKVLRDRIMTIWDRYHPGYGFAQHKGYGSLLHREALYRLGPSPLHRHSYRPVATWAQGRLWHVPR